MHNCYRHYSCTVQLPACLCYLSQDVQEGDFSPRTFTVVPAKGSEFESAIVREAFYAKTDNAEQKRREWDKNYFASDDSIEIVTAYLNVSLGVGLNTFFMPRM